MRETLTKTRPPAIMPAELAGADLVTRGPDAKGRFGIYGGRYVPETLMPALMELESAYKAARRDRGFREELSSILRDYVGRPTPITEARRLGEALGGIRVFLKREDLTHTGAHKINNTIGQVLLAKRMGRPGSSPRPGPDSTG